MISKRINWPIIGVKVNIANIPPVKNGLMQVNQAAYCMAHKNIINPSSKDLKGIYGASGPDLATALLSFDPKTVLCLDIKKVNKNKLEEAKIEWGKYSSSESVKLADIDMPLEYVMAQAGKTREVAHFWHNDFIEKCLEKLIVFELMKLGVNKQDTSINEDASGNTILKFLWAYPGRKNEKERTFVFVQKDITSTDIFEHINSPLYPGPVNFYYQKSAINCMHNIDGYLPKLAEAVRNSILISPISLEYLNNTNKYLYVNMNKIFKKIGCAKFVQVSKINDAYKYRFSMAQNLFYGENSWLYPWCVELWQRVRGKIE